MTVSKGMNSRKGPALSQHLRSNYGGTIPKELLPRLQLHGDTRKPTPIVTPSTPGHESVGRLCAARGALHGMLLGAGLWTAIGVLVLVWHPY
jgi:hypothetical protein